MSVVRFHHRPVVRFGNFFDDFITRDMARFAAANQFASVPKVNVIEQKENFTIELAAPGLKREDFHLNVHENTLKISAAAETEQTDNTGNYTQREFNYAKFERSFTLPKTIDQDNITARYSEGILSINLPKLPEAIRRPSREIEISQA
ncbi:MAG: Hsp20/alpha crystallin family protein [Bacteroidia bacterium]